MSEVPSDLPNAHDTDPDLRRRLLLSLVAVCCLVIAGLSALLRGEQQALYLFWAMLGAVVVALPIFWDVIANLRSRGMRGTQFFMDQAVALAVLACFAVGQYVTGAIVAIILVVGQVLEERSVLGVREAVSSLLKLSRVKARRVRAEDGAEEEVAAEELNAGDLIRLRPGDTVPADGVIRRGRGSIDQSSITGESVPVDVENGGEVYAGTSNLTGALDVEVTRKGRGTMLGRVVKIVEEAQNSQAPIMRLTDRYARYYAPLILIIAAFVLFFTEDINRAISVIIVSIPCAFVLASPTAMVAALATASRNGILVKSSAFFEAAREIDAVVFDKTGTLTTGKLKVVAVHAARGVEEQELLRVAAGVESQSKHPMARAVLEHARGAGIEPARPSEFHEHHGRGVEAVLHGRQVHLGKPAWVREQLTPEELRKAGADDDGSFTALMVAREGKFLGKLILRDTVRDDARAAAADLRALGITKMRMLTGDRRAVAEAIAEEVGLSEVVADCLPEDKLKSVEELKAAGYRVLVVGDGINDAPALARGDLGVAMGAMGSDVAIQTADVALMKNDLRRLVFFLRLSRRAIGVINQNIFFGFLFIALFMIISMLGLVPPVLAALLHEFSAFFVIFNSARLLRIESHAA
jgi:Cd2+/Zn2+-exporting ATPase